MNPPVVLKMSSSPKVEPIVSIRIVSADCKGFKCESYSVVFDVSIVVITDYMSNPISGLDLGYSIHRGLEIKRVPVIRIFGSTSSGL